MISGKIFTNEYVVKKQMRDYSKYNNCINDVRINDDEDELRIYFFRDKYLLRSSLMITDNITSNRRFLNMIREKTLLLQAEELHLDQTIIKNNNNISIINIPKHLFYYQLETCIDDIIANNKTKYHYKHILIPYDLGSRSWGYDLSTVIFILYKLGKYLEISKHEFALTVFYHKANILINLGKLSNL